MPRRLTLLAAAVVALALPASAAAQDKIQPGALVETTEGFCTLNFVYNGEGTRAGTTYIGTAAHCVSKIGDPVMDEDGNEFGTVAYIGDADEVPRDFSFIRVNDDQLGRVDPSMKGHPEFPVGSTTEGETEIGDVLQLSGYGVGFDLTGPTQEERRAILVGDDAERYFFDGPSVFGDSGGPVVHVGTGKALGIISSFGFEDAGTTDYGPTLEGVLAKAAKAGFPVSLRLAGQSAPAAPAPQQQQQQQAPAQQQTQTTTTPARSSQPAPQSARGKKTRRRKCKKASRGNRGKKGTVRKCRAKKKKSTRRR